MIILPKGGQHRLTYEDRLKGADHSKKARGLMAKLKIKELKKLGQQGWLEVLKTALSQPVVTGVLCYFAVSAVESMVKAGEVKPTAEQQGITQQEQQIIEGYKSLPFIGQFVEIFGVGNVGGMSASQIFRIVEFTALKGVILIYIATGGNLSGILQGNKDVIMGMLTKVGLAGAVGATP